MTLAGREPLKVPTRLLAALERQRLDLLFERFRGRLWADLAGAYAQACATRRRRPSLTLEAASAFRPAFEAWGVEAAQLGFDLGWMSDPAPSRSNVRHKTGHGPADS